MAHIHTGAGEHDHTIGAYIVRLDGQEPQVLLHMHKKLGRLLPVGGHIEINETPWQAVMHELMEESGYHLSDLKILQPKTRITKLYDVVVHPYPVVMNTHEVMPGHFHSDTAYAFVATSAPRASVGEDESNDLRWLTASQLDKLAEPDIFLNSKQIYQFILDECLNNWDQIETSSFAL